MASQPSVRDRNARNVPRNRDLQVFAMATSGVLFGESKTGDRNQDRVILHEKPLPTGIDSVCCTVF